MAAVVAVVAALLGMVSAAAGQDAEPATVTWGISPAGPDRRDTRSTIEHVVEPGQELVDHVVIDNYGEAPISLDLYAADARPANGEFDVMAADEEPAAVGAWVDLDHERVEIPARDHVIVAVTVRVPDDAEPGDHAGGILASRRSLGEGEEVGIETERRVGARVYLRVAGPVTPELTVERLDASYGHRLTPVGAGRVEVAYRVRNTGNIRLSSTPRVTVRGPRGLGERSAPGGEIVDLLPGHWVDQATTVEGVWPLTRLEVDVVATPTESAGQALDGAVAPGRARRRIWALPYAIASVALAALGVAVAIRRRRRRRRAGAAVADPPDRNGSDRPTVPV